MCVILTVIIEFTFRTFLALSTWDFGNIDNYTLIFFHFLYICCSLSRNFFLPVEIFTFTKKCIWHVQELLNGKVFFVSDTKTNDLLYNEHFIYDGSPKSPFVY